MKVKRAIDSWQGKHYKNTSAPKNDLCSVICTPPDVIKEFNTLVFHFLWNGKDKVTRLSTYAPYDQGGLKMLDYDTTIKP